jgi:hypothetical protein
MPTILSSKNDFILGDADYRWGFTTMDNTEYTAKVEF